MCKPFLKWVGGKRSILNQLKDRLPKEYNVYHEPFLGGGALFLAEQPKPAILSDINLYLIITFIIVRDYPDKLINKLKMYQANHSSNHFLQARVKLFEETDPVATAALFIYLNRTCFNGLYRVNKAGLFNVPQGSYKSPKILDEVNLLAVSKALQNIDIKCQDFTKIILRPGDFYYFDPPYHGTYQQYSINGFDDNRHELLADYCRAIDDIGGYFMVSNADTPFIRKLYDGFNIEEIEARRSVSCKAHQRGKETELIIRNY